MISNAISSLILVSSSLYATPVYISDVKAAREAGHLRVEVSADGGIDPESARTVIDDGRLIIYLGGARVRADNRSWDLQDGAGEIRAHRHRTETELVVPLTGNGCAGPVELTGTDTGITALVGCDGSVAGVLKNVSSRPAKTAKKTDSDAVKLKQLVELPLAAPTAPASIVEKIAEKADKTQTAATAEIAPTKEQPASTVAVGSEPRPRVASASATVIAAKQAAAAESMAPAADSATTQTQPIATASSTGAFRSVALPALLLAALAAVAYVVSRRRRGPNLRHIQILETTSLGPKRSLICARIGEETVILSSSEAGITLLKGGTAFAFEGQGVAAVAAPVVEAAAPVASTPNVAPTRRAAAAAGAPRPAPEPRFEDHFIEMEQPLEEALADIPDPRPAQQNTPARAAFRAIEGGLAGLFGKRDGQFGRDDDMASPFEDVLEDSLEDQELRQKLAAGMSARVR